MPDAAEDAAFLTRNTVDALPASGLEERLRVCAREARPLRVKLGLDPTAPDLHLGHTVVLQKLREFQDLGHKVVLIVGDYTARIGDPSGRSQTRPALSGAEIDANAETYKKQAFLVLLAAPERLEVRRNSEWLEMPTEELFALVRTTTVAQLLERNDFAKRFVAKGPISLLELLYPIMQGYDSVATRADVELGGTDQTFNLMLGRDIQRAYGMAEQCVLTVPILPGTDGTQKMSKSVGNHVGLTESPDEIYGKTLSIPDAAMAQWFALLAVTPPGPDTGPRDAKRALARALVARLHSAAAATGAQERFDRRFIDKREPEELEVHILASGVDPAHIPAIIGEALGHSRSEARRLLAQGAVRLDGAALSAADVDLSLARLDGAVLQVGKRGFRRLRIEPDPGAAPLGPQSV